MSSTNQDEYYVPPQEHAQYASSPRPATPTGVASSFGFQRQVSAASSVGSQGKGSLSSVSRGGSFRKSTKPIGGIQANRNQYPHHFSYGSTSTTASSGRHVDTISESGEQQYHVHLDGQPYYYGQEAGQWTSTSPRVIRYHGKAPKKTRRGDKIKGKSSTFCFCCKRRNSAPAKFSMPPPSPKRAPDVNSGIFEGSRLQV